MAIIGRPAAFAPIRVVEVELGQPMPGLGPASTSAGVPFAAAWVVVRLHGWPLGIVDVPLSTAADSQATLAAAIEARLGTAVRAHLAADGIVTDTPLRFPVPGPAAPACLEPLARVVAAPPSISVVVPTVDRPDALRRCLVGLRDQDWLEPEVIVVDNAPRSSGAAAVVEALGPSMPRLRRVEEQTRGASRARNRGVAEASGEVVAFLDGDATPDRRWLATLMAALVTPLADGARAICATGLILPASLETESQLWLEEWGGYAKGFERRAFDLEHRRQVGPMFPFAIAVCGSGASMALRASDLAALGGFDPALGPGTPAASGEDLALLLDAVAAGGTIVYEPGAIVWHAHPATEPAFRATLARYGVGLTAYLTRHLVRHPADAARLALAMPAAAAYFLGSGSARNRRRSPTFPRGVRRLEVGGMLRGPFAYAAGRAALRRRAVAAVGVPPAGSVPPAGGVPPAGSEPAR